MKKINIALAVLFSTFVLGFSAKPSEAAVYVGENVEIEETDNLAAIKKLEESGDLGDCPYPLENLTIKTPTEEEIIAIQGEETTDSTNIIIDPSGLLRLRSYAVNGTATVHQYHRTSGSQKSVSAIRCNELAPLYTTNDNAIPQTMVAKSSANSFYFYSAYTEDTGIGVYDGGYYYRKFNLYTPDWQWTRGVWLSVRDKADLMN